MGDSEIIALVKEEAQLDPEYLSVTTAAEEGQLPDFTEKDGLMWYTPDSTTQPRLYVPEDRDPRFTSNFWKALCKRLGTNLNMSTSHHPQTDGQTERANRTIEDMLRAYVAPHQSDWDEHLIAAEFAYNNSVQASTGSTPFYLNHGRHPHTPLSLLG